MKQNKFKIIKLLDQVLQKGIFHPKSLHETGRQLEYNLVGFYSMC